MECDLCYRPLTRRGNRRVTVRSSNSLRQFTACGRRSCQEHWRRTLRGGDTFAYDSLDADGQYIGSRPQYGFLAIVREDQHA